MALHPILIAGAWHPATATAAFRAENPTTGETLDGEFPVSSWADCEVALEAASAAAAELRHRPPEQLAAFLRAYADRLERHTGQLAATAHLETGLPVTPRLAGVELPRTVLQLHQAADAAVEGTWAMPTIDSKINLRSVLAPLGPVLVLGPNNFPFAYHGIAGGDFASALAAGNPVIAKAHPSHPNTSRLLAEHAAAALADSGLPPATIQMLYHLAPEDGLRLVSDRRVGAIGFTGSRPGGLRLKAAADAAGKPIYLELSSINPVVLLPGALAERSVAIVDEFVTSALMASGQFCTNPGLVLLLAGEPAEQFIAAVRARYDAAPVAPLLSAAVARSLAENVAALRTAGAALVTGGETLPGPGYRFRHTLLRATADAFLANPAGLQREAFGNASLVVTARDPAQLGAVLECLEGNLTGSIYSDTRGADDALYAEVSARLRPRIGRLLNDAMPTGVAVNAAMNHGGPFPATGHPGFTAVGFPAALRRFAALHCYDRVRHDRLPALLRNQNPGGRALRLVDGRWTHDDIA